MSEKEMQGTVAAVQADPVEGKATFEWTLKLYENQGNCFITWDTSAPFRAQQGKVVLYAGGFPKDPNDNVVTWAWDDADKKPFNTGKTWGTGWCAAYIAQASPNGPWVYFIKTALTK